MITLEMARDALLKAVNTQGRDFVYTTGTACFYTPETARKYMGQLDEADPRGKTGCLIGVALTILGETAHLDGTGYVGSLGLDISNQALDYFGCAQIKQDCGSTWGEAYDAAESLLVDYGWV